MNIILSYAITYIIWTFLNAINLNNQFFRELEYIIDPIIQLFNFILNIYILEQTIHDGSP